MTPRKSRSAALATVAVRGGAEPGTPDSPLVQPIVQSVNYVGEIGSAEEVRYPRYANTPNAELLQRRLALLEGTEAALVLSSGMAATACALLALLRPGDHLLASSWIYGGTHKLFTRQFAQMGIDVTLVEPLETRGWRKRIRKETRALFLETPVNPTCRVLDLKPASYLAKEEGLALVVDSTFASPVNFRPAEHGADVVIHSATKYLNGHHDVMAGAVLGTASYIEEVRQQMMVWGQVPDPFACWLLERGLKTLDVRVRRQNENAQRIAEWCDKQKEIAKVHYPGLSDHIDHDVASSTLDGFGGMMAIELAGGAKATERFLRRLKIVTHTVSLGGVETLIIEPRFSSHAHMSSTERAQIGIPDGFLRLSIGIEDPDDIIADLEQALKA